TARLTTRRMATRGVSIDEPNMVWPDPFRTPGMANPDVTQENIRSTICKAGWTATIRPPSTYTNRLKTQQIEEYGFEDKVLGSYEEDHLISLELGGHPTDARNLWPEPYAGRCNARVKDKVETKLKHLVCAGEVTLTEAQQEIAHNWVGAHIKYIGEISCPSRQ